MIERICKADRIFLAAVFLVFSVVHTGFSAEVTILARQYVTNTVHIAGGTYATPYIISTPNTEYILDGDIVADGTAIAIRAPKVVLNLNGKTVTYNQTVPGEGVTIDAYNLTDIAITNGNIFQGAALSEGDVYGAGNNPVRSKGLERLQIAGIHARYGGRDVGGFKLSAYASLIEENTLEDVWTTGTLKNRQQGVDAITCAEGINATWNVIRNNTIINARHRGITAFAQDQVYGNTISINSLATNSYGIFGYQTKNVKVYNNHITGKGEHPIGIGFVSAGTNTIDIYNNTIDVQTTRIGEEYGGTGCLSATTSTTCGNYAVGFRTNWGGNNINFHDNIITVHTDSAYQGSYSPTGQNVLVNGKGRGLMIEVVAGESSRFYNNTITTLDKDGSGKAFGIACTGESFGQMTFEGNTVTSNILNVALGDEYGACGGYPLFIKNTFVRAGSYSVYATIGSELNGYWEGTGRFISNAYQGGAAENRLNMNFQYPNKNKSIIFGRLMQGVAKDSAGATLSGVGIATYNAANVKQTTTTTAADDTAQVMVYDYELNNNNGLTQSATPVSIAFRPHVLELFNPADGASLFKSQPDSSASAWDALTSSGSYTLGDSARSLILTTSPGTYIPPPMDTTAPTVAINAPASGATVSGSVTVSATAADNVAVAKVELYVDGALQGTDPAPGPYGFTWNSVAVANGSHTLLAKAYDAAGNVGQSAPLAVTVNNTADSTLPTVSFTSPAPGAVLSGTVTLAAAATANAGISKVEFYLNSTLLSTITKAPYSFVWVTTPYSNYASCSLTAKAYDVGGNVAQSVITVQINNDKIAPIVTAFSLPATAASLTVPVATFTATDNTAVTGYCITATASSTGCSWQTAPPPSYTFAAAGAQTAYAWASDGAGNISASKSATVTISVSTGSTLWPSTTVPATIDDGPDDPVELGVKFRSDTGGTISGIRFYKSAANNGTHTARLWSTSGTLLGTASFSSETASGWQQANFPAPVTISANTVYIASYHTANGHYSFNQNYFKGTGRDAPPLHALADGVSGANGVYGYGPAGTFPNSGWFSSNYWVDVVFIASSTGDTVAPVVNTFTIPATSTTLNVPITSLIATDNTAVTGYLVTESSTAPLVADSRWSVNVPTTFTFGSPGSKTLYAWSKDAAGNVSLAKSATVIITLTVEPPASYTLWPSTTIPTVIDSGPDSAVQLGIKFRSDTSGYITGIRFYKAAANTGTHVGSLWSSSGTRLAVVTFNSETASGWQQANFSTPVAISANTVYVASYHTTVGHYSETVGYFSGKGVDNPPLHALADGVSGANSVYAYGTSTVFPKQTWQSDNYWVDVVFNK